MRRIASLMMAALWMAGVAMGQNLQQQERLTTLTALAKEDLTAAKGMAEALLKKNKHDTDLTAAIGTAFLRAERLTEAEHFYNQARQCHKVSTSEMILGGDIAWAKNKLDSAQYFYERAMKFDRKSPEAYYRCARLLSTKDLPAAVEVLQRLQQERPDEPVTNRLATLYYEAGDLQNAVDTYASIGQENLTQEELTSYATAAYLKRDYRQSLKVAELGHAKTPSHAVFNRLRMYNLVELKRPEEAAEAAKDLFERSEKAKLQYRDYIYRGYALSGLGDYSGAIEQFNLAMELEKDKPDIARMISEAYQEIKDYDNAIRYYEQYLSTQKGEERRASDLFSLGYLHWLKGIDERQTSELTAEKREELLRADRLFGEVAALQPENYFGFYWRARTNLMLDQDYSRGLAKPYYEQMISLLEQTGDHREQLKEGYKYLSYYFYVKKDLVQARRYAEKVLQLDPTDDYGRQLLNG